MAHASCFESRLRAAGVSAASDDNINYIGGVPNPSLANDFSHPVCVIAGVDGVSAISAALPVVQEAED